MLYLNKQLRQQPRSRKSQRKFNTPVSEFSKWSQGLFFYIVLRDKEGEESWSCLLDKQEIYWHEAKRYVATRLIYFSTHQGPWKFREHS